MSCSRECRVASLPFLSILVYSKLSSSPAPRDGIACADSSRNYGKNRGWQLTWCISPCQMSWLPRRNPTHLPARRVKDTLHDMNQKLMLRCDRWQWCHSLKGNMGMPWLSSAYISTCHSCGPPLLLKLAGKRRLPRLQACLYTSC